MVVDSNYTLFRLSASGKRTKLAVVGDQSFSIGGTRAAVGSGQGNGPITVVDVLTGKVTRIGTPTAANGEPSLSPDGHRLAWGGPGGIWVGPSSGGIAHLLVRNAGCPLWSPNGRSIAYVERGDLHVISASGGRDTKLVPRVGGCGMLAWSPDSKRIAFTPQHIDTVTVATRRITKSPPLGRVAGGLAWSPNGAELYVTTRPLAFERASDNCTNLWRLDAQRLTGRIVVRGCP
jgi:Tol biopolymer transport system component